MPQTKTVIELSTDELETLAYGGEIELENEYLRCEEAVADPDPTREVSEAKPNNGKLNEGTKQFELAKAVAAHDKEWVAPEDVKDAYPARSGMDKRKGASNALGDLYRKGIAERDEESYPYEYRLKESYRKELSQYDDLNQ